MLVDSALGYYGYSGDTHALDLVREALDYQLAHGLTPPDWAWGGVPYASANPGQATYQGADDTRFGGNGVGDGPGVIEPDKVGELAFAYLRLYQVTGDVRYRQAAVGSANVLARHVRTGSAAASPWPFRVVARTDEVRENYSANVIGPIMLFDELIRLNLGDIAAYRSTRQLAWEWLMTYPMQNNVWSGYFEDIPIQTDPTANPNQYIPMQTATYLLGHPDLDPEWRTHVPQLLSWVEQRFAVDTDGQAGIQWGARVISEQAVDMAKMGSHTARFAAINALWSEASNDASAREKAFRSFNWATYMATASGLVTVSPDGQQGYWFSDGYADYIRHFLHGMAAVPEWAPLHENHLLRSSSLVQTIAYQPAQVSYHTYDGTATDVLRLGFRPARVVVGNRQLMPRSTLDTEGYTLQPLDGGDWLVRVLHQSSGEVQILAEPGGPQPWPTPAASTNAGPVPVAGPPPSETQTVTFDDLTDVDQPLNGEYPAGIIEWGSGNWYLSSPWKQFTTNSISFNGGASTTQSFTFVSPRQLVSLDAYNGGDTPSTLTLSCPQQPDVVEQLAADAVMTIQTGWTGPCNTITITSSNGWDTNLDNLVVGL
jgi:hypothetical protein